MEREYRQEGELEREQEERTEVEEGGRGEEGEEERTRVAEGEDTFTESSAGLNRGRETSIMRANGRFGGGDMERANFWSVYLIYHYRLALIPSHGI